MFTTVSKLVHSKSVMSSSSSSALDQSAKLIFYKYDITEQVFYTTPKSFAFVNLKPLLPGHILISPKRIVARLTDLSASELTDLFTTVQKTQHMLARIYFKETFVPTTLEKRIEDQHGSFNVAIQDGVDSGQTIPHVHVHVIPRPPVRKGEEEEEEETKLGDEIYEEMNSEKGNLGGTLWDRERERERRKEKEERPKPSGNFPRIEDDKREARMPEVMREEAEFYRAEMQKLGDGM